MAYCATSTGFDCTLSGTSERSTQAIMLQARDDCWMCETAQEKGGVVFAITLQLSWGSAIFAELKRWGLEKRVLRFFGLAVMF